MDLILGQPNILQQMRVKLHQLLTFAMDPERVFEGQKPLK